MLMDQQYKFMPNINCLVSIQVCFLLKEGQGYLISPPRIQKQLIWQWGGTWATPEYFRWWKQREVWAQMLWMEFEIHFSFLLNISTCRFWTALETNYGNDTMNHEGEETGRCFCFWVLFIYINSPNSFLYAPGWWGVNHLGGLKSLTSGGEGP